MIKSFSCEKTYLLLLGRYTKLLPMDLHVRARMKLRYLDESRTIHDLRIPPSNYLKKLTGRLKNYHAIRINDQYRIIFKWKDDNAHDVKIVDYH